MIPQELLTDFNQGAISIKQIASRLNLPYSSVWKQLKKVGAIKTKECFTIPSEMIEAFVRREISIKEIAQKLNKHYSVVWKKLQELEVKQEKSIVISEELLEAYARREITIRTMAKMLNVSCSTLYRELQKRNVDTSRVVKKKTSRDEEVIKAYSIHKSLRVVGRMFLISGERVRQIIKRESKCC